MEKVLEDSHIVCLPSYYPEGLPKILCEAAACGRAVVTTDTAGCQAAIIEGETGIIVKSRDARALARAIESLLNTPERLQTMGRAGRRLAEREFDVSEIASKHIALYERMHWSTSD